MDRISIFCPTLRRPEKLKRFVESILINTEVLDHLEFVFGIEESDVETKEMILAIESALDLKLVSHKKVIFPDNKILNEKINALYAETTGDIIFAGADDLVIVTKDWDKIVRDNFATCPDNIVISWVNDGPGSNNLPRHRIMHRRVCEILGYFEPTLFNHYFGDNYMFSVIQILNRGFYFNGIVLEHDHPALNGAKFDKTNEQDMKYWKQDESVFHVTKAAQQQDGYKLLKAMIDPTKMAIHNMYTKFNENNAIFEKSQYPLGASLYKFPIKLRDKLNYKNVELTTMDKAHFGFFKNMIFMDMPNMSENEMDYTKNSGKRMYLLRMESPMIRPENYKKNIKRYFDKIWDCQAVIDSTDRLKPIEWKDKKQYCMILCNKESEKETSLYKKRLELIKWFEENHPDEFDLYGYGWENEDLSCYRGIAVDKLSTLSKYKYSFVFENAAIEGYISEKIFDCYLAGTIPIYLGHPENASKLYLTKDTNMIDKDVSIVYNDMKVKDENYYLNWLTYITDYFNSDLFKKNFDIETITNNIVEELLK